MPSYLVETYLARGDAGERAARERRARAAAEELAREGAPVRFHRSIHIPEDEICFFTFDASTAREAALAAQRAGLDPFRIVEAISSPESPKDTASPEDAVVATETAASPGKEAS